MTDAPHSRWFVPTPGRLLPLLLAVEGFLWLSQRFRWFAFNQHKGWTVLIRLATVGAALLLMFLWFLAALVFRLRFQYSLLSLLVLMVAVALPFAWLATEMKAARKQRKAVEEIQKVNAILFTYRGQRAPSGQWIRIDCVRYDYECDPSGRIIPGATSPGPSWLRNLLGDDLFMSVTRVDLSSSGVSDAGLQELKGLTQLQWLDLGSTKVSDAGLGYLKGLIQLRELDLFGTNVTDAGVKNLQQALPNCHIER